MISALVATVVPCENSATSRRSTPAAAMPLMTPSIGSAGVDGTFATCTEAVDSSNTKMSVNVPPTSTATRNLGMPLLATVVVTVAMTLARRSRERNRGKREVDVNVPWNPRAPAR